MVVLGAVGVFKHPVFERLDTPWPIFPPCHRFVTFVVFDERRLTARPRPTIKATQAATATVHCEEKDAVENYRPTTTTISQCLKFSRFMANTP